MWRSKLTIMDAKIYSAVIAVVSCLLFPACKKEADKAKSYKKPILIDASVSNSRVRLDEVTAIARSEVNRINPDIQYEVLTNYIGFSNGVWRIWLWEEGGMPGGGVRVSVSTNGDVVKIIPDLRETRIHQEAHE